MSRELVWSVVAVNNTAGFLSDDLEGVQGLFEVVDQLADDPRPTGAIAIGSPDLRRLQAGRYRILYEIVDDATISVIHIGRLG